MYCVWISTASLKDSAFVGDMAIMALARCHSGRRPAPVWPQACSFSRAQSRELTAACPFIQLAYIYIFVHIQKFLVSGPR